MFIYILSMGGGGMCVCRDSMFVFVGCLCVTMCVYDSVGVFVHL